MKPPWAKSENLIPTILQTDLTELERKENIGKIKKQSSLERETSNKYSKQVPLAKNKIQNNLKDNKRNWVSILEMFSHTMPPLLLWIAYYFVV